MAKANKQQAQKFKEEGNKLFAADKFAESLTWYVKAIQADPTDHVLHSNRSAAHLGNKEYDKALEAAEQCIKLNGKWAKGYYRKALALISLNRNQDALATLTKGLSIEPGNADLKLKLEELKKKGKPQGMEAKAEGNAHFKESRYDHAIEMYTIALETVQDSQERATIHSNRAACYYQLRSFEEVVIDSTETLKIDSKHEKSLLRRGLAYEALEKQKLALEDLQQLLSINSDASVAQQAVSRIKISLAMYEKKTGKKS